MNEYQAREAARLRQTLREFYGAHGRHDLPWRQPEPGGVFDPYKIVVSELMLQQTQVPRVVPKFAAFTAQFPDVAALAAAPLCDVLRAWSGLGYNRRAKFLWQTAGVVQGELGGRVPTTRTALTALPGIGPNTAGAVLAYAFNQPAMFVETNIRSVFIHHFFADGQTVHDAEIVPLLEMMLSSEADPRTFYWALMDYGTHLKQTVGNAARRSHSYATQSAFAGSRRQLRGQVLRALAGVPLTVAALGKIIQDERLNDVLGDLCREQMIVLVHGRYQLPERMIQ